MTKFIAIVSGKGGVGKTTTTVNLGSSMHSNNHDSLIVDANLSTPNIGLHLGVDSVPVTFHDVLEGRNHILESVYKHNLGFRLITSDISYERSFTYTPEQIEHAFLDLVGHTNTVLVDTAAGIGNETKHMLQSCDEALVVCNPELSSVVDARKMARVCEDMGVGVLGVIVTRFRGDETDMSIKNVETMLEYPVISIIPDDYSIRLAQSVRSPVNHSHPESYASRSYNLLANKIITRNFNLKDNFY